MKNKDKRITELEAENRALNARIFYLESPVKQILDMSGYAISFIKTAVPIIESYEKWGEKVMRELEKCRAVLDPRVDQALKEQRELVARYKYPIEVDFPDPCARPEGHESQPGTDKCKHCNATYQVNYGWHVGPYPRTFPFYITEDMKVPKETKEL
jgi:hypothetical protein